MGFDDAEVKGSGERVWYGEGYLIGKRPYTATDWIERRVPSHLATQAHELIDKWLIEKGYNPEDI
jgi:hypothetical protein